MAESSGVWPSRTLGWASYFTHPSPPNTVTWVGVKCSKNNHWPKMQLPFDCESHSRDARLEGCGSRLRVVLQSPGICGRAQYFLMSKTEISENAQPSRAKWLICSVTTELSHLRKDLIIHENWIQRDKSSPMLSAECLNLASLLGFRHNLFTDPAGL